ncbi:hypothetical protein [Hydrogenobaculum acidophilum]
MSTDKVNDQSNNYFSKDYLTFDLSLKGLAKLGPKKLIQLITNHSVKSLLPTEYQKLELKLDYVVELDNGDILHVEFQSVNDPMMHFRMLEYLVALIKEFKGRNVIQVVLYLIHRQR